MKAPTHFPLPLIIVELADVQAHLKAAHKIRYGGSPPTHFSLPLVADLLAAAWAHLEAAHKMRYDGSPPTHFPLPLTAVEVAELDAIIFDKSHYHEVAKQAAALAELALAEERRCNAAVA